MSLGWLEAAGRLAADLSVGPISIVMNVKGDGIDVFGTIRVERDSYRGAHAERYTRVLRVRYQDLDTAPTNMLADGIRAMERTLRGTRR